MRSLAVVMKGPAANAGLKPKRFSTRGVSVPVKEASKITENKAADTTMATFIS